MKTSGLLLFLASLASSALGHSWIHCTDYRINEAVQSELDNYDDSKCMGYPRHFKDFDRGFGVDAGYNYLISADGDNAAPCPTQFNSGTPYSSDHPMAKYSPGQKVCLAWPTKNHVAAACNNQFIPDGGVKIYRSGANPGSQASKSQLQANLVQDLGATATPQNNDNFYGRVGYQRCPKFCSNNDKAMCTQCFTVPSNLAQGTYTFAWFWIFNTGQLYTSCWEAEVGGGGGNVGTGDGSSNTPTQEVLGMDQVAFTRVPSVITSSGSFEVDMQYNAAEARMLVVDILSTPDYAFYGKGTLEVQKGEGTATLTVTVENNPPDYKNYVLKGWIVKVSDYEADATIAYQFELDRIESPATIGEKVIYSAPRASGGSNGGAIAGAFFGGFILCALIAAGALVFYKYKGSGKI